MYQCKVDVAEEDRSTFLEVAEDLQIREKWRLLKTWKPLRDDPSIVTEQYKKDTLNNILIQCTKD